MSLKNGPGKSPGPDGVSPEHLKYGGPAICVWLKRVFNAIADIEVIPPSLNHGLITPIPKGDPTNPGSYRVLY